MKSKLIKFISDPKQWLSIAAIVISIFSLYWTLKNQVDQNRRWDLSMLGQLTLSKATFIVWKEISKTELDNTDWGYEIKPIAAFGQGMAQAKYKLLYALRFADANSKPVEGSAPFFTLDESKLELDRFRKHHPQIEIPQNGFPLIKQYNLAISFEVDGATKVKDVEAEVYIEYPETDLNVEILSQKYPFTVSPGRPKTFNMQLFIPHTAELPPRTLFHVIAHYTDSHDQRTVLYVDLEYYRALNRWGFLREETKTCSNLATTADAKKRRG